jgi:hypothetical protein
MLSTEFILRELNHFMAAPSANPVAGLTWSNYRRGGPGTWWSDANLMACRQECKTWRTGVLPAAHVG